MKYMTTGPDGQSAYKKTDPKMPNNSIPVSQLTGAQFESTFAYFLSLVPDYTGSVVRWNMTSSTDDILNVEINQNSPSSRKVFSVGFNDQAPIGFLLPNSSDSYQRIGFTLRDGTTLSVYADCFFLGSVELTSRATANDPGYLHFFTDATPTNPAIVSMQVYYYHYYYCCYYYCYYYYYYSCSCFIV